MSINLNDSINALITALAQTIEDIEPYLEPFVLEQDTEPQQPDWEAAWLVAGNTLPISEDQELYWKSGDVIRGQFGRTNDRFYAIFPSNSVALAGVTHFAYTKFLGWEDEQHFLFSGTELNDSGQYTGLLRAYLDGTLEQVDFTGFTANTLLGYDEAQGKLWYIEGTDLKRIDTTTEVITVIAAGITVAPTTIAFDGAGDAFCTINIGAGLDTYRWNNGAATFTSFKASITVNGVGEDPGQVITASLNYVVVLTSVSNYWIQIARAGGAETQIKSNPGGATADNLPQPDATTWVQTFAGRTLDILSIVFTELTGTPGISEWRRTLLWDMATASYTENTTLPYDDFIAMCIAESPNPDPLNYDARRDINYHTLTSAYRKRVANAWEYHNLSGIRVNNSGSRQIIETDDGQIFIWSNESSGKIWRISSWDQSEPDSVLVGIIDITGMAGGALVTDSVLSIDVTGRPKGYDILEITAHSAIENGAEAVLNAGWRVNIFEDLVSNNRNGSFAGVIGGDGVTVDANTYVQNSRNYPRVHGRFALNPQSLAQMIIFAPEGDTEIASLGGTVTLMRDTCATGVVNETVVYQLSITYVDSVYNPTEFISFTNYPGAAAVGKYLMVRALRTEGRRQGGAYYAPSMA